MNTENNTPAKTSDKTSSSLIEKIRRARVFLVGLLVMLAIFIGGAKKFTADITSNLQDSYVAISRIDDPTFTLFKEKLEAEGIKPDISEMSVFLITEANYKYKWQRGNDERIYVIRRNSQGNWDAYIQ